MKVCVIGTGYVGLVAGACLAEMGNDVICVDNDKDKLEKLKNGVVPIYEPGLEELITSNTQDGRLKFSDNLTEAVRNSLICYIAVGTPQGQSGDADLSYVLDVAENIGKAINEYKVIVDKSTVPVGTAEKVSEIIGRYANCEFDVVSNPEFLKQGKAVDDFLRPDRIIIGSNSDKAIQIMQELYSPYVRNGNPILIMDVKSAEMTKYAANAFLAMKISFINQLANLCEKTGANIEHVKQGISSDKRIGSKFLFPGLGYGGSCFPKDVKAIINTAKKCNCDCELLSAIDNVNCHQREIFIQKIMDKFDNNISGKIFAVWGLSFKPNTNDMREAPSITIINSLLEKGAIIQAYDPKAYDNAKLYFQDKIIYAESTYDALNNADALLLVTEWNEFRNVDFDTVKNLMKNPVIFDGRNLYNPEILRNKGFYYRGFGN